MLVAARRPVHKDQSLSYDIKDIVEQASAQWQQPPFPPPLFGSLCKEVHVFIFVVMGMNTHRHTHTSTELLPPSSVFNVGHVGSSPDAHGAAFST